MKIKLQEIQIKTKTISTELGVAKEKKRKKKHGKLILALYLLLISKGSSAWKKDEKKNVIAYPGKLRKGGRECNTKGVKRSSEI